MSIDRQAEIIANRIFLIEDTPLFAGDGGNLPPKRLSGLPKALFMPIYPRGQDGQRLGDFDD
ncbi:hypothetical protein N9L23_00325 [Alphaproteobacteria bacterium]|nr:hypothetical protein [Alphaproteobacteria bacterium]